jgi:hypothetical protein
MSKARNLGPSHRSDLAQEAQAPRRQVARLKRRGYILRLSQRVALEQLSAFERRIDQDDGLANFVEAQPARPTRHVLVFRHRERPSVFTHEFIFRQQHGGRRRVDAGRQRGRCGHHMDAAILGAKPALDRLAFRPEEIGIVKRGPATEARPQIRR